MWHRRRGPRVCLFSSAPESISLNTFPVPFLLLPMRLIKQGRVVTGEPSPREVSALNVPETSRESSALVVCAECGEI